MVRVALVTALLLGATEAARSGTVSGTVVDDAGRPVAGATVAANSYEVAATIEDTRATALATSDSEGRFPAMSLGPGTYAFTATAPGRTAAYLPDVVVAEKSQQRVQLSTGGDGITLSGNLRDLDGNPVSGAQVRAVRISDLQGDVFVATDVDGSYRMRVPLAPYALCAEAGSLRSELRIAMAEADETVDLDLVPPPGPPGEEVVRWLGEHAIPLRTVEAGHGFGDMQPLRDVVGDAQIVSLGEATHGTREFFRLKHRMLEFLVEEMGFTVFAIEASLPDALAVNDFVLRGKGDAAKALAGLGFWTWNTEAVLELILWMRAYNEDPAHETKIEFWGFDMQAPIASVGALLAFLRREDPEVVARLEPLIDRFSSAQGYAGLPDVEREETRSTLDDLRARLAEGEAAADPALRDEWALAVRHVDLIRQAEEMFRDPSRSFGVRDRAMAENVDWIRERQPPGAGIVLWAHNGHVTFGPETAMGSHLRRDHGEDLVTFGFAFHRGGFRAVDTGPGRRGLISFEVDPPSGEALESALAAAGEPIAAFDLRTVPKRGAVARWFRTPRPTRSIGALFDEGNPEYGIERIVAPNHYDVLLFVENTTAAIGNRPSRPERPVAATAANLDFESGAIGEAPSAWILPESCAAGGFRARVVEDGGRGSRAARLDRGGEFTKRAPFGNLMQKIDAAPYRGRTVTFRAAVRSGGEASSRAQLWFRVDRENSETGFFENMGDRPIVSPDWAEYEITGTVDEDAAVINFGMMLFGKGPVWVDDVSLEIVGEGS